MKKETQFSIRYINFILEERQRNTVFHTIHQLHSGRKAEMGFPENTHFVWFDTHESSPNLYAILWFSLESVYGCIGRFCHEASC